MLEQYFKRRERREIDALNLGISVLDELTTIKRLILVSFVVKIVFICALGIIGYVVITNVSS